jgi:hypothetical protein
MGLSSSQGRLLSDIELSETTIAQRQNQLAWDSEKVAKDYNEAISNYKLTVKVPDSSQTTGYKTQDLNYSNMTSLGYLVTDAQNQIYLEKDEDGNWIIPKNTDGQNLLSIDESTGKAVIGTQKYSIADGTNYLSQSDALQTAILNGRLFVLDTSEDSEAMSISMLQSNTDVEYVLDTSDDAEAESKYEYESARISRQDNQLDMELQQLETEHETILKEYDSIKSVISDNIDRTFKLFSDG